MTKLVLAAWLAAGCQGDSKPRQPPPSQPSGAPPAPADAAAVPIDAPLPCVVLYQLENQVNLSYVAKDHQTNEAHAKEIFPAVPENCHKGRFYLAAAFYLALPNQELVLPKQTLTSEEQALTAALVEPETVDVYVRVAQVAMLGRGPKLPADACAKARELVKDKPKDDAAKAAYVCARVALAKGDGETATKELATIEAATLPIDLPLARAEAAKLVKDGKTLAAQKKLATQLAAGAPKLMPRADLDAMVALAKRL
jgi:hypothetical protein